MIIPVLFLAGCTENEKPPERLLSEQTYIDVIVELQLVESYMQVVSSDSVDVDSLTREVFDKYGVTREQFMNTHDYYQQDIKKQKERITRAIDQLRMEMANLQEMNRSKRDTLDDRGLRIMD